MPLVPGNDLNLGLIPGRTATLQLPRTARDKHLYVCGGTGTGKSKFLENLIRQDIVAWRKSKCGLLVLDPHGSLYDSLVRWVSEKVLESYRNGITAGKKGETARLSSRRAFYQLTNAPWP